MINPEDYKEPSCKVCSNNFYNPQSDEPDGRIPISRVIEKLDEFLFKEDYSAADNLLTYWQQEAESLKDYSGELTVLSEMMGLYRRTNNKDKGLWSVDRGFELVKQHNLDGLVSTATIYLNGATTLKHFGKPRQAIEWYQKVVEVYKKNLDPYDYNMAGLCNNMALAYAEVKEYEIAEEKYKQALDIMLRLSEKSKDKLLEAAITLVNMAYLYFEWSDFTDCVQKTLSCMDKAYEYFTDKDVPLNGYYAFCCSKSIPAFKFFGYESKTEHLEKLIEKARENERN